MASRIVLGIIIIAMLGATGFFVMNYKIESHYENGKLAYMKITPRGSSAEPATPAPDAPPAANLPPPSNRLTFRIAAFNLGGLDENKLSSPRIADILSRTLARFELIAVQGLRGKNQGVAVRLVDQLNALSGRQYEFVTCPTQRRDGIEHYSAFFFDKASLEIDRPTVRFVEDPLRRFRHKPLIGSFRARGPKPTEAFTFTLVAVDTDAEKTAAELDLLADVFRAVRDDGRNEDDIIMLGDFEADSNHLGRLGKLMGITPAISDMPTTASGAKQADNILFDRRATVEFTGRAEVVDLMREFNLTIQAASELSEHLPLWAEFSVYEGGPRGYVPKGQ
jgi:hypothetical protein